VLAENAGRWESASSGDLARIEAIARAITARLLHEPTIRLKALDAGASHRGVELIRDLFGLPHSAVPDDGEGETTGAATAPAPDERRDNVRELRRGNVA
jgi:hypothetical protein